MATPRADRERMRDELRELAKFAKGRPPPPDNSGYVDLSAFSMDHPGWAERELARAHDGGSVAAAGASARAVASVAPEARAPLTLGGISKDAAPAPERPRRRGVVYAALACIVSAACVGGFAFEAARYAVRPAAPRKGAATAEQRVGSPAAPTTPPSPSTTEAATVTDAATTETRSPAAPATPSAENADERAAGAASKKLTQPARRHVGAPPPSPAVARKSGAARPAAPASTKSPSSHDALMDAMRASIVAGGPATGSKNHH